MLHIVGWIAVAVIALVLTVNGLFMLFSPRAWFRLPRACFKNSLLSSGEPAQAASNQAPKTCGESRSSLFETCSSWIRAQGSLTEAKYGSGWGAFQVRLTGVFFLAVIFCVLYEAVVRRR
jgi:hypothetical protein